MRCGETTTDCIDLTTVGGSRDAAASTGERPRLEIQRFLFYVHPDTSSDILRALSAGESDRRVSHADAPCGRLSETTTDPCDAPQPRSDVFSGGGLMGPLGKSCVGSARTAA